MTRIFLNSVLAIQYTFLKHPDEKVAEIVKTTISSGWNSEAFKLVNLTAKNFGFYLQSFISRVTKLQDGWRDWIDNFVFGYGVVGLYYLFILR